MDESPKGLTIGEALRAAASVLGRAGLPEARREAASLLMHLTGRDRAYLFTREDERLDEARLSAFEGMVRRRASGEPLQYITGRQEFYGLEFEVDRDVLIPRPETELLVETALELLRDSPSPLLCDVGTGSGCVVVSLLHERRDARAFALDISQAALRVAERNATRHGVAERLRLLASDCFDALSGAEYEGTRFDLIASNPPYVAEEELAGLQREVREHEPRQALTPGGDGLCVIARLIEDAPRFLSPRGYLVFEIGFGQHERVERLVDAGVWTLLDIRRDLQGIPRTVVLRLAE